MKATAKVFINIVAALAACLFAIVCVMVAMCVPNMSRGNVLLLFALGLLFVLIARYEYSVYVNEYVDVNEEGILLVDHRGRSVRAAWSEVEVTYVRGSAETLNFKIGDNTRRIKSSYSDFHKLVDYIDELGHLKREKSRV